MTGHTRFCVLFAGNGDGQLTKTRLLRSDSSREDLIEIWKQMYSEEAPTDAELVNDDCVYRLDDDDDIAAFLAQAEDQYRLLPSQPLRVLFVTSHRHLRSSYPSPPASNDAISLPSTKSPTTATETTEIIEHGHESDAAKDTSCRRRIDLNSNNNNVLQNNAAEGYSPNSSHSIFHGEQKDPGDDVQSGQMSSWSSANALLMLYNRFRGRERFDQMPQVTATDNRTVGGAIESITMASASNMQPNRITQDDRNRYHGGDSTGQTHDSHAAYAKHLAGSLGRPTTSFPTGPGNVGTATNPTLNHLSACSAFMNNFQEQKQYNPNASYILQALFNNHVKGNLSRTGPSEGSSKFERGHAAGSNPHVPSPNLTTLSEYSTPTTAFQAGNQPLLMSTLAQYNNNSLLHYGAAMTNFQNGLNRDYSKAEFSKKNQKKRKERRNGPMSESTDSSKRMRSSVSQSNIEYHYQRAVDYSQMTEEDQKLQNSAHRSHWKHLLFVAKVSPKFLERFRHAKYDEWSSEARDIFAICQPDKYMWSFLTLSKQGDMLCKRIIARIDGLMSKLVDDRPDWCPDDERLLRAQTRARERLSQLQRILYSRSANQEAKTAEKANQLERLSMQEKNLALMTAYYQSQHELIRNQQPFIKDASLLKENCHPSAQPAVHCSSVTSSPVSVASPAFEDNNSARSVCTDSPASPNEDNCTEQNLVIIENRNLPSSPEPTRNDIDVAIMPTLPFAASNASPNKWSSNMGKIADM